MPTAAERIYDTAAGAIAAQQARADQITSTMGPIGAGAAAGALILKPALHDFSHAGTVQTIGVYAGIAGLLLVLGVGIVLLRSPDVPGVKAADLLRLAVDTPSLLSDSDAFHLAGTPLLVDVWQRNRQRGPLVTHKARFTVVAIGLLLEVAGLAVAAEIQPRPAHRPPSEKVTVTAVRISKTGIQIDGQLTPAAPGAVGVVVRFHGRATEVLRRTARVHDGGFTIKLLAKHSVAPLRSGSYRVVWMRSIIVSSAQAAGTARPARARPRPGVH
ncbi:MAG: hypothetical protein M3071_11375 [Actinomycetota bacterium]|nr:hypothetical protein [Actinomycetota bacterium]